MLILARRRNETILITGEIPAGGVVKIEVLGIENRRVKLGIQAAEGVKVLRGELKLTESDDGPATD
jgi:carbon storage regulator CsrA